MGTSSSNSTWTYGPTDNFSNQTGSHDPTYEGVPLRAALMIRTFAYLGVNLAPERFQSFEECAAVAYLAEDAFDIRFAYGWGLGSRRPVSHEFKRDTTLYTTFSDDLREKIERDFPLKAIYIQRLDDLAKLLTDWPDMLREHSLEWLNTLAFFHYVKLHDRDEAGLWLSNEHAYLKQSAINMLKKHDIYP